MARSLEVEPKGSPSTTAARPQRHPGRGTSKQAPRTPASGDDDLRIITYVEPDEPASDQDKFLGGRGQDQFLSDDEKRSLWQRIRGVVPKIDTVSPETLQANLSRFLRAMEKSLSDAPVQLAEYRLDEIEVAVEVSAEGEVSLLGNGAKVGGKGTLTLKLKHSTGGT
jgi:hypothetical protein